MKTDSRHHLDDTHDAIFIERNGTLCPGTFSIGPQVREDLSTFRIEGSPKGLTKLSEDILLLIVADLEFNGWVHLEWATQRKRATSREAKSGREKYD